MAPGTRAALAATAKVAVVRLVVARGLRIPALAEAGLTLSVIYKCNSSVGSRYIYVQYTVNIYRYAAECN
jgi:hypothetical protein